MLWSESEASGIAFSRERLLTGVVCPDNDNPSWILLFTAHCDPFSPGLEKQNLVFLE